MEENLFLKMYTDFIFAEDRPEPADIIFIPGSGWPELALRAAALWKEGFAPQILPSGRYSILTGSFPGPASMAEKYPGPYETEWEFLRDVLLREGVPPEAILKEDTASYTYENAIRSRQVTDAAGLEIRRAILCCQAYHGRRALLYYQLLYPHTRFYVCPAVTRGVSRENWHCTAAGTELVLGEMERCGSQFHEIMKQFYQTGEASRFSKSALTAQQVR